MRFLGVSETCDLGALYMRLLAEGHEVRVAVSHPLAQGTLAGLVPRTGEWRAELPWVRAAGSQGVILFESVSEGFGALQDELRRDGFQVVGGSAYGDRLENDRGFAQQVLAELGFPAGHVWTFDSAALALAFLEQHPGRFVIKRSGAGHEAADTYVGQFADGSDVIGVLRAAVHEGDARETVLMRHIAGIEVGVGAYFNGRRFIRPACVDWEHKRFFAGDLGELTGEMGTVVTFERSAAFFELTLGRMESRLREHGHVGYVNLNTMVNDQGVWPLEFTCRFGYPGFAILTPLQATPWGELLAVMAQGRDLELKTRPGFCLGVVLTTPPFPYSRDEVAAPVGLPVLIDPAHVPDQLHYGEVGLDATGRLVTSGLYGWTMVATGVGLTIAAAKDEAYRGARAVAAPNIRYRLDIGDRLIAGDHAALDALGIFGPANADPA